MTKIKFLFPIFLIFFTTTYASDNFSGEYSYSKKLKQYELGASFQISNIKKPSKDVFYKAHFNGYYLKGDMPSVCDFEGNLNLVKDNVFSFRNLDGDIKYNLIVIIDKKDLLIYSTEPIDGCGQNSELSVPGLYTKK